MNVMKQWADEHKEEIENQKNQNAGSGMKCRKMKAGENIITLDMKEITEKEFDFDGTKVKRYFYVYEEYDEEDETTYPLLVPKSVHFEIVDQMQEYGDKLEAVKVKKKEAGKNTEYKTFPVLKTK